MSKKIRQTKSRKVLVKTRAKQLKKLNKEKRANFPSGLKKLFNKSTNHKIRTPRNFGYTEEVLKTIRTEDSKEKRENHEKLATTKTQKMERLLNEVFNKLDKNKKKDKLNSSQSEQRRKCENIFCRKKNKLRNGAGRYR